MSEIGVIMSEVIVVGSQWGDEGKGKVVDLFSAQADLVVRYQGGANAGHTLIRDGKEIILHLLPSGILHESCICLIAAGVVLDVEIIAQEIRTLKKAGLLKKDKQLLISDNATLILPYHRVLDMAREHTLKQEKIGTTGKGIGPAYEDRASRRAILFRDIFEPDTLKKKLQINLEEKNHLLSYYQIPIFKVEKILTDLLNYAKELRPYRSADTSYVIEKHRKLGHKILYEGAQGTLLDLLHGTYPFVTSSSTLAGSACVGSGTGPLSIKKVVGITKAYCTRVGNGPFPTELQNKIGQTLQKHGKEYGATTGRKRRCGWLDLVALKYAIRINGITSLALMKLDVLTGLEEIAVATSYLIGDQIVKHFPLSDIELNSAQPHFKVFSGWQEDIKKAKTLNDLPKNTRYYLDFLEDNLEIPIDVISVGPSSKDTIWINPLFKNL